MPEQFNILSGGSYITALLVWLTIPAGTPFDRDPTGGRQLVIDPERMDMRRTPSSPFPRIVFAAVLPVILFLAGCGTAIVSSQDPSHANPYQWRAAEALPVELHGNIPARSETALASLFPQGSRPQYASLGPIALPDKGKRVVMYVNAAFLPPTSDLCSKSDLFRPGRQVSRFARVTAALCDGPTVISVVRGDALSKGQTEQGLQRSFGVMRAGLVAALKRDATEPYQFYRDRDLLGRDL
jgi:hypothetical protein